MEGPGFHHSLNIQQWALVGTNHGNNMRATQSSSETPFKTYESGNKELLKYWIKKIEPLKDLKSSKLNDLSLLPHDYLTISLLMVMAET